MTPVARSADGWAGGVNDVTPPAREIHRLAPGGRFGGAPALLPAEPPYPGATS